MVRLGTLWSGVEIAPFTANETYLGQLDIIIRSLREHGIYVILDAHQDILSTKFGSYDAAPRWLIDSFPPPRHAYPWPLKAKPSNWMLGYITEAAGHAFECIYDNVNQALDHYSFFWQTMAHRFGQYENVLGFELMNEPWPGDVMRNPLLFVPGRTGHKVLLPFYDHLVAKIDAVDNRTMIFYEPLTWGMIVHGSTLGSGFSRVPGGDRFRDRAVFSYHYYCWFAGVYNDNPFPKWLRSICDHMFFPKVLQAVLKDTQQTGGASFLTEFGQCKATAAHNTTEYQECLSVLNHSEESMVSWTYWDSKFYNDDGTIFTENVKLFSRPYAMAIAGIPFGSAFDTNTRVYEIMYFPRACNGAPSVIYVSPYHYPNGYTVQVSTGLQFNVTYNNYVEVTMTKDYKPGSLPSAIKITPL